MKKWKTSQTLQKNQKLQGLKKFIKKTSTEQINCKEINVMKFWRHQNVEKIH